MKTIISLFLSIIFLSACNQSDDFSTFWEQQPDNGKISITRAGKKWRGVSMVARPYDHKEGWRLSIGRTKWVTGYGISFQNIPETIGTHSICIPEIINIEKLENPKHIQAAYTAGIPDDHRVFTYACQEDSDNHFTISEYNSETREVTGSFRILMRLTYHDQLGDPEELIVIESKEFTVQIRE